MPSNHLNRIDSAKARFDITYYVDKTSVHSTSQNMKNNLQPKIENFNNNIHTNHLDSINGVHIFNYDSVIHRHGMKHPQIVQQPMIIITLVI